MDELSSAEIRWIKTMRGEARRLLNHTEGGDGCLGYAPSPETRQIKSVQGKAMWLTKGYKENHIAKMKVYWDDPQYRSNAGKTIKRAWANLTEEQREFRLRHVRAVAEARRKPLIDQHGRIYESVAQAAKVLGLQRSHIQYVLRGERAHTRGYTFQWVHSLTAP